MHIMIWLFAGVFLMFSHVAAQTTAITQDGKTVILYPDGTWKHADGVESPAVLLGKFDRQESLNRGEYLEFKQDGTFLAYNPSQGGFSGKYEVDGSTVKLSLQGPTPFTKTGTYDKAKGVISFRDQVIFSGAGSQTYSRRSQ